MDLRSRPAIVLLEIFCGRLLYSDGKARVLLTDYHGKPIASMLVSLGQNALPRSSAIAAGATVLALAGFNVNSAVHLFTELRSYA